MQALQRRDVILLGGLLCLAGIWVVFPFADAIASIDSAVLAVGIVVSFLALVYGQKIHARVVWRDVAHWPMALAGIGLLTLVVMRQWWQYVLFDTVVTTDGALDTTSMLLRYGVIQLVTWVLGWCYVVVAVWPATDWRTWYTTYRYEVWGVGGLVLIASVLRLRDLGAIPNIINGDEGLIGMWAVQLLTQNGTLGHVFVNMDGVGTNYLLVMKGIIAVFGQTALAIRLIPAIFGIIAVATNYLFARTLFGVRVGMISAALLTFAHVHVHFSRTVAVSYIYATALLPLLLWALWMLVHTRRTWPAVIAALTLSLHINMYVDAWAWAVLVILIVLAWSIVDYRMVVSHMPRLGGMVALMFVGILPMLIWGIYFPGDFFARLSTDGSFVSGWLTREAATRQVSLVWIVVELYQYAFSTLFRTPFEDFYHANVPILDRVSAVFFFIGLVLVHNKLHTPRMLMLLGWFWGGMSALAVFTIPVSTYPYRLLVILPIVLTIVALGIDWLATFMRVPRYAQVAVAVVVGVIAFLNVSIYHTELATVCRYGGDRKTEQAGVLARYTAQQARGYERVVVLGMPPDGFYYGPWRSPEYLNPTVTFLNLADAPINDTWVSEGDVWFVAVPERKDELLQYQVQYAQAAEILPIEQCGEALLYVLKIQ